MSWLPERQSYWNGHVAHFSVWECGTEAMPGLGLVPDLFLPPGQDTPPHLTLGSSPPTQRIECHRTARLEEPLETRDSASLSNHWGNRGLVGGCDLSKDTEHRRCRVRLPAKDFTAGLRGPDTLPSLWACMPSIPQLQCGLRGGWAMAALGCRTPGAWHRPAPSAPGTVLCSRRRTLQLTPLLRVVTHPPQR